MKYVYYINIEIDFEPQCIDTWHFRVDKDFAINNTGNTIVNFTRHLAKLDVGFEVICGFVFTKYCVYCFDGTRLDQLVILYLEAGGGTDDAFEHDDILIERMALLKELARLLGEI